MHFYDKDGNMTESSERWPDKKEDEQITLALSEGLMPSVTTFFGVIRYAHLEKWLRKITLEHFQTHGQFEKALLFEDKTSSERGTKLHNALEHYLLSDMKEFPTDITEHEYKLLSPFPEWAHKNITELVFCERSFSSQELGWAGTADLGAFLRTGSFLTGDFKFKKHSDMYPMKPAFEYACQLSAYDAHFGPLLAKGKPRVRQNFLFNSGLGYSVKPCMKVVSYLHDYLPYMKMVQQIWLSTRAPETGWLTETFEEADMTLMPPRAKNKGWDKYQGANKKQATQQ